jgi:hemoglobin
MSGEMSDSAVKTAPSLFARVGGEATVDRLVEAFYRHMDSVPAARSLRAMHEADLSQTKAVLKHYLGEWMGGPKLYSQERGHPRLRQRHLRFGIGPSERDQWMLCMDGALKEVLDDDGLREQLRRNFYQLADWVRNDKENPHDKH